MSDTRLEAGARPENGAEDLNPDAHFGAGLEGRLRMAQQPGYEGEILSAGDHIVLFTAGIVLPVLAMLIAWVVA